MKSIILTQRFKRTAKPKTEQVNQEFIENNRHTESLPELTGKKRSEQQSQNIRALSNIVSKLDILQGEVKYFALRSHLNQKLRADDLITDNWPKDDNNTHQYFIQMEKELK